MRQCGLALSGSGYEQVESFCEFGIEPSGSINAWKLSSGLATVGFSSSAELQRVSYTVTYISQ
jgi:hypothetical protein